jgi:arabinose-5-phosphate isomerase
LLKSLFEKKREYLSSFFEHIDISQAESCFRALRGCQGNIVFTGVGKSGLVAEKISLTMISTGSRACYLSPTNALHGDLGILTPNDLFVMLSKSGETDELLHLIPYLRNRNIPVLGIVSSPNSRLSRACDICMTLPSIQELCPFNLAPTTSTTTQLIFGDVLAIALMQDKNFTLNQYMLNHPGGSIGKRLIFKVQDLMLKGTALPLARPEDKLVDVLVEMSTKCCGCILIVDADGVLQGFFSDGDLRRALLHKGSSSLESLMQHLMTVSPRTTSPECLAWEVMQSMNVDIHKPITRMPVVDEQKRVIGLVRLHDFIHAGL